MLWCLRLGTFFCFAGWTWVHFYWQGPYGSLLWNDQTFELMTWLGFSWDEYVGSGSGDGLVQQWCKHIGWLSLICAIVSLTVRPRAWFQMAVLFCGSIMLAVFNRDFFDQRSDWGNPGRGVTRVVNVS